MSKDRDALLKKLPRALSDHAALINGAISESRSIPYYDEDEAIDLRNDLRLASELLQELLSKAITEGKSDE